MSLLLHEPVPVGHLERGWRLRWGERLEATQVGTGGTRGLTDDQGREQSLQTCQTGAPVSPSGSPAGAEGMRHPAAWTRPCL